MRARAWMRSAGATIVVGVSLVASSLAAPQALAGPVLSPTLVQTIGGPGHAAMYPSGVEFSAFDGTLVVADTGNHRIEKFDPVSGDLLWSIGGYGTGIGRFSDPRDVGVGSDGSIFVADTGNVRIVKLAPDGTWLTFWKGPDSDKVGSPIGISASTVGGVDRVYIADGAKLRVRVWNAALTTQSMTAGTNGDCVFSNLRDADADSKGNIYVANYLKNDILKLDPSGTCIRTWGSKGTANGQFKNPYGVRVTKDGVGGVERVFVADSNNNRIQVFSKQGAYVDRFGTFGTADQAGTFSGLRRVAVAPDGDLWGADLWGWSIEHADASGRHGDPGGAYRFAGSVPLVPGPPPFTSSSVLNEVRQVAFDNAGGLLAIDTVNQRVVRFDPTTGALIPPACGQRGWENGAFNWPRGVAVDPTTNQIWVADTKQSRLQILQDDCAFVVKVPSVTGSTDRFNWPQSIAIRASDATAWVADTKNNRIKVYDVATRALLATYGAKGSDTGEFLQPKGIAIDPISGNVLVADTNNNRVVELTASPDAGSISWSRSLALLSGNMKFKKPSGIARDTSGRTFVADSVNNRVLVLDPTTWSQVSATLQNQMSRPEQVAVGPDGRIYVSDTYNDRILVYQYP